MAKRTRFLRDEVIAEELKTGSPIKSGKTFLSDNDEKQTKMSVLHGFYEAFRKFLISGLTKEDFAHLYAQTLTYGLFAARTRSENGFNRKLAYDRIPRTIGILRDVFKFVSLGDLPQQMEWIIDDISEVLAVTDVKNILHQYFHEGKGKDPIVHFYETFLAQYDPETREKRGVYYTPEPVVSYIVRSLHGILKEHFGREDGFTNESVTVLDPAAGTLTFLAEAAKLAVEEFVSKYGEGGRENLIKDHKLKNFYAFELMMAPYAVGHIKMSFLLEELGFRLRKDDRFKLYLINTLETEERAQTELPGMASLSEESHLAGKVKKETPILVILGNPPYSGISANKGDWITQLIEDYKYVDGKHYGERKHWLQDDYVKFIRFAQWKIDQAGEGAIGFISNHSYLDNPTFRGMRQSLMNSFSEIYILDLRGNSLKKEKCPDGSKDGNVFDIQQGVTIALFIKKKDKKSASKIYHSEVWGLREKKYDWLLENGIKTTKWKQLNPTSPYYFFVPREEKGREIYEKYWKITEIFPVNVTGIVTARDGFVIDFNREVVKRRIATFRNLAMPDELVKQTFKLNDTKGWKFSEARKELAKDENWDTYFTKILYRPFDVREIYYMQKMVHCPRSEIMRHMLANNVSICFMRQVSLEENYTHFFVSEYMVDNRTFLSSKGIIQQAPLYLHPDTDKKDLFSHKKEQAKREPNINPELFKTLSDIYTVGQTFLSDNKSVTDKNVCSTDIADVANINIKNYNGDEELKIARRHLPHWTLKGATYFVTFRAANGELSIDEQKLVLEHIIEGNEKFYTLIAAVVMPDHVHLLLTPNERYNLNRIMKGIKGVSARQLNLKRGTSGSIWQDESFDGIIRDQNELNEKLDYMLNNPVKRGLTDSPWDHHVWYFNDTTVGPVGQTFLSDNVDNAQLTDVTDKNVCSTNSMNVTPEEIFYYIYAVLYSNNYRTKYAEFLKIDFPRVPFTKDYKVFSKMGEYGKRLVDLHLLKSPELDPPVTKFQGKGENKVEKLRYVEKEKRVYINQNQYFEGIAKDVWEYQIGGYQVCDKWLKDRKGRALDDIRTYCKIATALQKTLEIQKAIDIIYPETEKETVPF